MPQPHTRLSSLEVDFSAIKVLVDYVKDACNGGNALLVTEMSFFDNGGVHITGLDYAAPTGEQEVDIYAQSNGYVESNGLPVRTAPVRLFLTEEDEAAIEAEVAGH